MSSIPRNQVWDTDDRVLPERISPTSGQPPHRSFRQRLHALLHNDDPDSPESQLARLRELEVRQGEQLWARARQRRPLHDESTRRTPLRIAGSERPEDAAGNPQAKFMFQQAVLKELASRHLGIETDIGSTFSDATQEWSAKAVEQGFEAVKHHKSIEPQTIGLEHSASAAGPLSEASLALE